MSHKRALLFGSFNPVTNAHIQMGVCARNVLGKDFDITYVPAGNGYIKSWKGYMPGSIMDVKARIRLLEGAVKPYGFSVSSVEAEGVTDGRTYNTVKYYGFDDCVLCLGMDNIMQMKKWFRWKELLIGTPILVFRRGHYRKEQTKEMKNVLEHASAGCTFVNLPGDCDSISSTRVRNCYVDRDLDALKTLVPENVFDYLRRNGNVYI